MRGVHVVYDVNVFVDAVTTDAADFTAFPSPPPLNDDEVFAACVGIANDAHEVSLFLSEHVLDTLRFVLATEYGWDEQHLDDYEQVLLEVAKASGGGLLEVNATVAECEDPEDDNILALAVEADAEFIVSNDGDLTQMSPWRGRPIMTPREFANRINPTPDSSAAIASADRPWLNSKRSARTTNTAMMARYSGASLPPT